MQRFSANASGQQARDRSSGMDAAVAEMLRGGFTSKGDNGGQVSSESQVPSYMGQNTDNGNYRDRMSASAIAAEREAEKFRDSQRRMASSSPAPEAFRRPAASSQLAGPTGRSKTRMYPNPGGLSDPYPVPLWVCEGGEPEYISLAEGRTHAQATLAPGSFVASGGFAPDRASYSVAGATANGAGMATFSRGNGSRGPAVEAHYIDENSAQDLHAVLMRRPDNGHHDLRAIYTREVIGSQPEAFELDVTDVEGRMHDTGEVIMNGFRNFSGKKSTLAALIAMCDYIKIHKLPAEQLLPRLAKDDLELGKAMGGHSGISSAGVAKLKFDEAGTPTISEASASPVLTNIALAAHAGDMMEMTWQTLTPSEARSMPPGLLVCTRMNFEKTETDDKLVWVVAEHYEPIKPGFADGLRGFIQPHYIILGEAPDLIEGVPYKTGRVVDASTPGSVTVSARSTRSTQTRNICVKFDPVMVVTMTDKAKVEVLKTVHTSAVMRASMFGNQQANIQASITRREEYAARAAKASQSTGRMPIGAH